MKLLSDWMYTKDGLPYRTVLLDPDEEAGLVPLLDYLRSQESDPELRSKRKGKVRISPRFPGPI